MKFLYHANELSTDNCPFFTYRKNEIRKKEKEDKKAVYTIESIPFFIFNVSNESLETIALFLTLERIL